ncbi:DUF6029 family protein [Psychroserpens sp. Hel_I_66]|uniref:DUF6029 family protein n=1 Tax=Psychroserpens sp. Hel_I_66 TaxID=1250004 RepID=UPI00064565EE|nr:DUF6029 family protein [Psychroserpens sp. Hel_I_66]
MKKTTVLFLLILPLFSFSQETESDKETIFNQFLNNLTGSFESNAQWYVNDNVLGDFEDPIPEFDLENKHLRANSYLRLDYNFLKNFTIGVQVESYEPLPLLSYFPEYRGTELSNYYINFRNEKLDITAGHFYEQFGSGLLLRAFEERQLGLNNALRGGRIKYMPTNYLNLTALYGKNRIGFDHSEGDVFGLDLNLDLKEVLDIENLSRFNFGASYVGKSEDFTPPVDEFDPENTFDDTDFPELINSYAFRFDIDFGKFFINSEYSIKGEDISYTPASIGQPNIIEGQYFDGSALLFTTGYTVKGFGVSSTFRRLENMTFFSERELLKPGNNPFGMGSINFLPALTKQQDYALSNIYLYQAQSPLFIQNFGGQAGEIGGQIDIYYTFKKGSPIGGKYGTKITGNMSYWSLLDATFNQDNSTYDAEFLKFGEKLYKDINFEIKKKWSKDWSSVLFYQNLKINKNLAIEGSYIPNDEAITSNIIVAETTRKFDYGKSIRLEAQHLFSKEDNKNWAGGTLEYVVNRNLAFYVADIYNYGNDIEEDQNHYYNFGGSYTKGATRVALNYGRQRGGLFCVGGVCRFVPENTGLSLNVSTAF